MISFDGVNWLAVVVGVIGTNVLGFLWYGPLFGAAWMRMIGKTADEIESNPSMFVVTFLASAVTMTTLAVIVGTFAAESFVDGLIVGALAWIGVGATTTFVYTTFEGPPTNVWFLHAIYQLVAFAAMGGIFAVWR